MAKDAKTRARAKALYEKGQSLNQIAQELDIDRKSVMGWSKKESWIKGKAGPKLDQIAEAALEKEAARLGLDRARVTAKIAQRLEAKMAVRVTDSGSFSTCPLPPGTVVDGDGKVTLGGERLTATDDARTQDKALDQAIAVLGMAKETVTINPSDEFRKLWALAKGSA